MTLQEAAALKSGSLLIEEGEFTAVPPQLYLVPPRGTQHRVGMYLVPRVVRVHPKDRLPSFRMIRWELLTRVA